MVLTNDAALILFLLCSKSSFSSKLGSGASSSTVYQVKLVQVLSSLFSTCTTIFSQLLLQLMNFSARYRSYLSTMVLSMALSKRQLTSNSGTFTLMDWDYLGLGFYRPGMTQRVRVWDYGSIQVTLPTIEMSWSLCLLRVQKMQCRQIGQFCLFSIAPKIMIMISQQLNISTFKTYACIHVAPHHKTLTFSRQVLSPRKSQPNDINFIINSSMLKFKEIKRAIIHPGEHDSSPILHSRRDSNLNPQITFKTIKQQAECSPFQKRQLNQAFVGRCDTDKKVTPGLSEFNVRSETKENQPKNIYYNRAAEFSENEGKRLDFGHKKRKTNNTNTEHQRRHDNSASKNNNPSFASLLQSKRPEANSKNKTYLDSDRKMERQSSISKLKEKLFGMKKVISQKQKPKEPSIYRCETQRNLNTAFQGGKNIFKGCRLDVDDQDLVKISIKKEEGSIVELDMAPYF